MIITAKVVKSGRIAISAWFAENARIALTYAIAVAKFVLIVMRSLEARRKPNHVLTVADVK